MTNVCTCKAEHWQPHAESCPAYRPRLMSPEDHLRAQIESQRQEIERLRAHRNVCVQYLRQGAEQIRAADQRLSPYYMDKAKLLRIAVILDSAAKNAMTDESTTPQPDRGSQGAGETMPVAEPVSRPASPPRIPPREFDIESHSGLYTESPSEPGVCEYFCPNCANAGCTDCRPEARNLGPLKASGGVGVTDLAARPPNYNPFHAMEERLEAATQPPIQKSGDGLVPLKEGPRDKVYQDGVKWLDTL